MDGDRKQKEGGGGARVKKGKDRKTKKKIGVKLSVEASYVGQWGLRGEQITESNYLTYSMLYHK